MVIAHTAKAGQYAKAESSHVYERTNLVIFTVTTFLMLVMGVLIGLSFITPWLVVVALPLMGLGVYVFSRLNQRMTAYIDDAASERLKWLRGGQAEAYVSMTLRRGLRGNDRYHLFDNLKLDPNSDLDHVLIGPSGLYVISTKSHRGHFQLQHGQSRPTFNNQPIEPKDWARDAVQQALRLRDALPHYADDPKAPVPWVQAVLCLPFAHIDTPQGPTGVPSAGKCWVLHEDNLIDHVAPDANGEPVAKFSGGSKLRKAEIDHWVAALQRLSMRHTPSNTGTN